MEAVLHFNLKRSSSCFRGWAVAVGGAAVAVRHRGMCTPIFCPPIDYRLATDVVNRSFSHDEYEAIITEGRLVLR